MVREGRCSPGRRVHHRRWGKTAPYPPDVIENMGHNRTRLDRTGIFGYEDKMWVGIPGRLTRYSARARPDCDDMTFNCHTGPSTPQNGRNRRLCARFTALAVLFWCCVFLTGALGQTISDNITSVGPGMVGVRIEERTVSETPPVDSISGGQIKPPALLDSTASYTISSDDDPNYVTPRCPSAVYRKTRPIDLAYPLFGSRDPSGAASDVASLEHSLYLALDPPLAAGKTYTVTPGFNSLGSRTFVFGWGVMRSDAVHANHAGFRPDEPSKVAFLSLWTGSGGARSFVEGSAFYVCPGDNSVDCGNETNRVFAGLVGAPFTRETAENWPSPGYPDPPNYSFTDVYPLDFSAWQGASEGTYRVCVEDVGCSYPFEISGAVWQNLFLKSVRALYFQRSGTAVGTAGDIYHRPLDFGGLTVSETDVTLLELAGVWQEEPHAWLVENKRAGTAVGGAWGGYHDAGDWQRRVEHLDVPRLLFDLYDAFPARFQSLSLNLPQMSTDPAITPPVPDLLREALWSVDFFKRLQISEPGDLYGAVRGGINSGAYPTYGERSFEPGSSLAFDLMAYCPDVWSSYLYAAAAAQTYTMLKKHVTNAPSSLVDGYLQSALDAMNWAEKNWPSTEEHWARANGSIPFPSQTVTNARNLAAAELFRATGDSTWHEVFAATTFFTKTVSYGDGYDQIDAAWTYYNTDRPGMSEGIRGYCRDTLVGAGHALLYVQPLTGFRLGKNISMPAGFGNLTGADRLLAHAIRAHMITRDAEQLKALILGSQSGLGANPVNMSFTTGIGHKYPKHLFHHDSRGLMDPPPGITVEGPLDSRYSAAVTDIYNYFFAPFIYPGTDILPAWPPMEAYADAFWPPIMCEFQINQTVARNAYVWGYLAALRGFQAVKTRSLGVSKSGAGSGKVTSNPTGLDCGSTCVAVFSDWADAIVTAVPDAGSTFAGWGGDASGTAAAKLAMTKDRAVTATFDLIPYTFSVAIEGNGVISATGLTCNGSSCLGTYPYGTVVNISATPAVGSVFSGWTGCDGASAGSGKKGGKKGKALGTSGKAARSRVAASSGNVCTVTVTGDKSVSARFVPAKTLKTARSGSGTVISSPSGIDCGSSCSAFFVEGTTVKLSASPASGNAFAYWTGACTGASGTCSVLMSGDSSVTAVFNPSDTRKHQLLVSKRKTAAGDGSITSDDGMIRCGETCRKTYYPQTPVTLIAVPSGNSTFTGWGGACSGTGPCSVAMDRAKLVTASFTGPQRLVLVKQKVKKGDGTVTSSPSGISCGAGCTSFAALYPRNGKVTLSANPGQGSTFTGWKTASHECEGTGDCTVTMDKSHLVVAIFTKTFASRGANVSPEEE